MLPKPAEKEADLNDFWKERVKKIGHTGWGDEFIYAYDQQARLMAVDSILNYFNVEKTVALDFGTGSGDFADLLSKYFKKVIAFDITESVIKVAKEKYKKQNIDFLNANNIDQVAIDGNSVDVILSVTVLDCIMEDKELIRTIKNFYKILKKDGVVIAFEYASDSEKPKNFFQRFMRFKEWRKLFLNNGLDFQKFYNFYHPLDLPCESYYSYRKQIKGLKGLLLRATNKYINADLVNRYLNKLALESLQGKNDFFWDGYQQKSPIKIMIFKKS